MKKFQGVYIKNEREIACLAEANRIVSNILDAIGEIIAPGLVTMRIEELTQDICAEQKVKPAFQGYFGYPYAVCCSVNEQVVHGFPSDRKLVEGDIVSIDVGVIYEGFVGDAARSWPVGVVSEEARRLMRTTEDSLYVGIGMARPGNNVFDIGAAVQQFVEAAGFNVVRRFVGHGVGVKMHEKPEVPNFKPVLRGVTLRPGMVIAIEPMVTAGTYEVDILDDKWTAVTCDGKLAAHFEHSVAITHDDPKILSISDRGFNRHTFNA
ncbi:MAG: type I methionyl aminopeptidase [Desulfovibrio sp.]|jgi:methionyl aminopeptidase|nr:type I methionyl aminopeptidase [Desulfovibrio sp.]